MAEQRHIERIYDTQANGKASLDAMQIMIESDGDHLFTWKDNTSPTARYYTGAAQKYWDGAAYTYLDNDFNDVTARGDIYGSEYIYHYGDTDTRLRFQDDQITVTAGNIDFISIVEGASDYVKFNPNGESVVVYIEGAVSDAGFVFDASDGQCVFGNTSTTLAYPLEVRRADEDPIVAISAIHATDYDPQIRFLTDDPGTVKWSLGVDSGDSDGLKIYSGSGVGGTSEFVFSTDGRLGIGTNDPFNNVVSASGDYTGVGVHIKNDNGAAGDAHLILEASDGCGVYLCDTIGTVDERISRLAVYHGGFYLGSNEDDLSVKRQFIISGENATGNVCIGDRFASVQSCLFSLFEDSRDTQMDIFNEDSGTDYNLMITFSDTYDTHWAMGVDRGDSNKFKISNSGDIDGTNDWVFQSALTTIDGYIRSNSTDYRRYYHADISALDPGASGATWVDADANTLAGWKLDANTEYLDFDSDIHADWDGASNPTVEIKYTVNVDNTGGTGADTVDFQLVAYYKGFGDNATKSQTISSSDTVGASDQYKQFHHEIEVDWDYADNVLEVGDVISFVLSLATGTSDIDDITVNEVSFYYPTTHVGIETLDV